MAIQYRDALDQTFHALGDGTRRGMLAVLTKRGECSAGELGAPFDIAQPTASKHLAVLERAGLVRRRVEGRQHFFRIDPRPLDDARGWIARHRDFWEGSLDRLRDAVEETAGG